MPFVPAKCTQCGANITVDDSKEAAICEFCGTAFVTEKAINNYHITNNVNISNATINVAGANVDNLLLRAEQYEEQGDFEKAKEYCNRVLDIDATNQIAQSKLKRLSAIYLGKTRVSREQFEQVRHNMQIGEKLTAIKLIRQFTGLGLKDAKDIADSFDAIDFSKPQNIASPANTSQSGGCYIATAVYGSYDCPEVWTLRRFRDNSLAKNVLGRLFIRTYYSISPLLVKWFGNTEWFKMLWKPTLNRLVTKLNSRGVENTPYND